MHMNHGSSKRRKQGDRIFKLRTFCHPGHPTQFHGVFRENIRALLEFGHREEGAYGGMECWSFQLEVHRHPPIYISLFIIEEMVESSPYRRCHFCKLIGWDHHMICNKRYHFVLPSKGRVIKEDGLNCESYGKGLDTARMESTLMNLHGQIMHGVVHSNGFGHLLCLKGIEGGSEIVSGHQILDLWDRICASLRLRKVSLTDTARKGGMNLRLIHGVAYGKPWFGRWGYKFGRGSYGVTQQMYQKSIEALQALPLCLIAPQYGSLRCEIPIIITKYQTISGNSLLTLGQLFHFMLELRSHLPADTLVAMDYHGITAEPTCRWSVKRVEMAAQVVVDALKKAEFKWVSRQDVRDAARLYIGDTGLLDFVLKSLGNHVVGNYLVRRMVNPATKVLEYCLEDISNAFPHQGGLFMNEATKMMTRPQMTRLQVRKDLFFLYEYILKESNPVITSGVFSTIPIAVRTILDTKQLVKDHWEESPMKTEVAWEGYIDLLCTVCLRNEGIGYESERWALPPHELLYMPAHATMGELKTQVEKCFKEVYLGLKSFSAEAVWDVGGQDTDLVFGLLESGSRVVVGGRIEENIVIGEEIYEGGNNNWTVDCLCGAKEEDGERMISCDICEVWQHTRCVHIPNNEDVPSVFLCSRCEHNIIVFPSILS